MHETNPTFKGIVMRSDDRIFFFELTFSLNTFKCTLNAKLYACGLNGMIEIVLNVKQTKTGS